MRTLFVALALAVLSPVQAIYFYLEPGQERCFKDEVVKNYVSTCQRRLTCLTDP